MKGHAPPRGRRGSPAKRLDSVVCVSFLPPPSMPLWSALLCGLLALTAFGEETRAQEATLVDMSVSQPLMLRPSTFVPTPRTAVPALVLGAPDFAVGPDHHLALELRREIWLLSVAGRFWLASRIVPELTRTVPPGGLASETIRWSFDRGAVGASDLSASRLSDHARQASLLLPVALSVVTARTSERWRDVAVGGTVYAEALLLSKTLTHLGKGAIGRPRPGLYVGAWSGSDSGDGTVVGSGAFHSMPSSHASTAWTGAATAFASHLLLRPRAGWAERAGVGFVGGALAGATSALRVSAGAHFPSDVIAGAGIGIGSGILVPLLHRGGLPLPSREAWLQTMGGVVAGTVVGVLLGSR